MFKVNWRRSGVFRVNFEHISHLVLVFLLLTLNFSSVPIVNFEMGNSGWVNCKPECSHESSNICCCDSTYCRITYDWLHLLTVWIIVTS